MTDRGVFVTLSGELATRRDEWSLYDCSWCLSDKKGSLLLSFVADNRTSMIINRSPDYTRVE